MSAAVVVRNLLQPIAHVAHILSQTVTNGRLNNDRANQKAKLWLERAAAVQIMCTGRWEALIMMCVGKRGMNNKRLGGRLWMMFVGVVGQLC